MRTNSPLLLFLCLASLCACKNSNASDIRQMSQTKDTITTFVLPSIPTTLRTPELRATFLVKHYWDHVNFSDTNYIHHPEVSEQAWADYCDLLNHVPLTTAQEAIRTTIEQTGANKQVFRYFTELADKYLYDPNSPLYNEEFYIPVLDAMIASPLLEEIEKVRPRARRQLAQKNRIGTKASDFQYTCASGQSGSLYQRQEEYILLYINNPGCHACEETTEALKKATVIHQLLTQKRLAVLSIYPDEELDEWRKHLNDFPQEWINGYDRTFSIREKELYDLRAIPTLYLLDKEKNVLLKDAAATTIEEYLLLHQ